MKSSSQLFPVRLMSADSQGNIAEDVYLLKPNNSPDRSVELAVTHLMQWEKRTGFTSLERQPIILLHGRYQNRGLWYSWRAEGLACFLIDCGFDVWIPEARGHGLSPRNQLFDRNTLSDYARYDVPAVNAFVTEQTGRSPLWLGYGEGGGSVLLALADSALAPTTVAGLILLGLPFPDMPYGYSRWLQMPLLLPMGSWLIDKLSQKPPIGSEPEPFAMRRQLWCEQWWLEDRGEAADVPLWKALERVSVPVVLCLDPARQGCLEREWKRLQQLSQLEVVHQSLPPGALGSSQIQKTLTDAGQVEKLWAPLERWLSQKGLADKVSERGTLEKGPYREILSTGEAASTA